ncbi:MAG: M24 family metallopeptidase [Candidatus Bathyarchaeia archaeon]
MSDRIKALKAVFNKEFDGYIIANQVNILYFTDFSGAAMMLVPNAEESILYVYGVNYEAAKAEAKNCKVELIKQGEELVKKIAEQVGNLKLKKLGFDAMNVEIHQKFLKAFKNTVELETKSEYVWSLRRVKDEVELEKIRKAAELTVKGMQTACDTIKAGLREYEVAAEIEYAMRIQGSYGVAFDTSVASGLRSAYPHGGCGEKKLENGELVVVDIGSTYKNYCADMTRTFVVSKPSVKQERIYTIVKNAQERAFQEICDGKKAAEVDAVARNIIKEAGYGEHFVHGLGHGIGLEVHEQPVLNSASKDVLKAGNVVTDEPGTYIVGFGGFRIEDTVLVKKGTGERLTEGLYVLKIS